VYKIGYQNSKTAAALKQDLLVMENLFYERKISQVDTHTQLICTGRRVDWILTPVAPCTGGETRLVLASNRRFSG